MAQINDEWRTPTYRQRVIQHFEEILRQHPNQKTAPEFESMAFQSAKSAEEYRTFITRIVSHISSQSAQNPQQANNPHLTAVLAGPGNVQMQMNHGMMPNNQVNMMGGPQGMRMMAPNMGGPGGEVAWAGPPGRQMQMQMGPTQMIGQGKMGQMQVGAPGGQIGPIIRTQMVPGMTVSRQPVPPMPGQVPSPSAPSMRRQGTPTPVGASPASALMASNQPSPAFISPSPSSMIPSPASVGTRMGHYGVPSPGGGMMSTPGSQQQLPSPASVGGGGGGEENAYRDKIRQLTKYVDPLRRMIQRIGSGDTEKLNKMKNLLDMLTNPTKRMPMDTLLKCEKVLEKLEIHEPREPEMPGPAIPPNMDSRIGALLDSITNTLKSPNVAHTLHRSLTPALSALLGPHFNPPPLKRLRSDSPPLSGVDVPSPLISDIVQGEVARLNSRFRVSLDPLRQGGGQDLVLVCQLDDVNLPCVPPIYLTVPADYPERPPTCQLLPVDYDATEFLQRVRNALTVQTQDLPPHCTLTMLLHSWEMSVRQACSPKVSCVGIKTMILA